MQYTIRPLLFGRIFEYVLNYRTGNQIRQIKSHFLLRITWTYKIFDMGTGKKLISYPNSSMCCWSPMKPIPFFFAGNGIKKTFLLGNWFISFVDKFRGIFFDDVSRYKRYEILGKQNLHGLVLPNLEDHPQYQVILQHT